MEWWHIYFFYCLDYWYAFDVRRGGLTGATFLLSLGITMMVGGFCGRMYCHHPYNSVLAWSAPIGLMVTFIGIMLILIPDFFVKHSCGPI